MKKQISFIIFPLIISSLASCSSHTHFDKYTIEHNEDEHWKVCSCGQVGEKVAHNFDQIKQKHVSEYTDSGIDICTCSYCKYSKQVESNRVRFETYPEDLSSVSISSDEVYEWLQDYELGSSQPYQGRGDIYYPKDINLTWDVTGKNYSHYSIYVALDMDVKNGDIYESELNYVTLSNLFVDTVYYWQIEAFDNQDNLVDTSTIYSFLVEKTPRTISIEGVSNSRDIGGKETTNDKIIKQGMLFRSANLDSITDKGRDQALNTYGIKTDLDLRNPAEITGHVSPISKDVQLINVAGCYWVGGANGLDVEENWKSRMLYELKPFTDPNNYPMIFHCAIGQDRTGSLAIVIEGLLGATLEEITIDYELSSFSSAVWDPKAPIYVQDKLRYQYLPLINYINGFGTEEEPFMDKCERYVKAVGFTEEEIEAIRDIMWEE